jgi:molybdopterin/thiamine biosynthesis adenylyltransferase
MSNLYNRQDALNLNQKQSITIVGCGGIGYWVAKFAAMSGIDPIYLYDPDTFEEHNFNRIDLPIKFISRNKADITRIVIHNIRPNCTVYSFPFKYSELTSEKTDWIIDCTDSYKSQLKNQEISKKIGSRYLKSGYDGEEFSIHNSVAEWGEAEDGYQIVPSWVVPATIVAALTIGKIMKYVDKEVISNVSELYKFRR